MRVLLINLSCLFLFSCSQTLLNEEEENYLIKLAACDKITVYQDGININVDIVNSDVESSDERKLFSTAIAQASYLIASKKLNSIDLKGNHVISFIGKSEPEKFIISNRKIFISEDVYKNLYLLFQYIFDKDRDAVRAIIDTNELGGDQLEELVEKLFSEISFEDGYKLNSYGFQSKATEFDVYIKLEIREVKSNYIFRFNPESKKLLELIKL